MARLALPLTGYTCNTPDRRARSTDGIVVVCMYDMRMYVCMRAESCGQGRTGLVIGKLLVFRCVPAGPLSICPGPGQYDACEMLAILPYFSFWDAARYMFDAKRMPYALCVTVSMLSACQDYSQDINAWILHPTVKRNEATTLRGPLSPPVNRHTHTHITFYDSGLPFVVLTPPCVSLSLRHPMAPCIRSQAGRIAKCIPLFSVQACSDLEPRLVKTGMCRKGVSYHLR
ncbi:hypothetical protein EJ05DRAFT_74340 [Pseudovirgaria hyperparasitica]|uniref:Uncharacterized protein n=1 Tax=Pseudovirgaria hyperparasitica TaxID=470096 RepID=A0A6A6W6K9_9PEZI|nr:uncharacterized protein EJ05DRAFT_74340 [Pseudovirgaria hyperparasitica]KAF2756711.1 hypothetical protein EJ05DRAFT_74340 [Pseudovirgaria hyperparasitica]